MFTEIVGRGFQLKACWNDRMGAGMTIGGLRKSLSRRSFDFGPLALSLRMTKVGNFFEREA